MKIIWIILFMLYNVFGYCQEFYPDTLNAILPEIYLMPEIKNKGDIGRIFKQKQVDTTFSLCQNELAVRYYQMRLNAIRIYLHVMENDDKITAILNKRKEKVGYSIIDAEIVTALMDGILNFEYLTGIMSESKTDFFGKSQPTRNDEQRWEEWFQQNKEFLCWDDEYNVIYLREK